MCNINPVTGNKFLLKFCYDPICSPLVKVSPSLPKLVLRRRKNAWQTASPSLGRTASPSLMITITPEYAGHLYNLCIDGKENAKLTGDDMQMSVATDAIKHSGAKDCVWLEYAYCKHHQVLRDLPTKLAEWIKNAGPAWIS